jgi:phosphoesterase RecJ-like protein
MSYETPGYRKGAVREVLDALSSAQRILLTTHVNADGDGAGCEVAMVEWLRDQGKEAWIINPTPFPESFGFLLRDAAWCLDPGGAKAREMARAAELAVVLDTGEVPRLGRVQGLIRGLPRIVVDHHPAGPDPIPGISFRDPEAGATGELVFDLLAASGREWPPNSALGVYVAILTDTGSFRFSNASPRVHRIVAELLELGVDAEATHRKVYGDYPLRKLQLLHACLGELEVDPQGDLAWMTVPTPAYNSLSATPDDLEGLVDYPRAIRDVEVGLLFRETIRGGTKVSFRSNGDVDVNALARRFGGGGHTKAAGALVEAPLEEVRSEVIEATRRAIRSGPEGVEGP